MESSTNRYSVIGGAVGCLFGVCLMYPGNLQTLKVIEQHTHQNTLLFEYDDTDVKFLQISELEPVSYQFKSIIPGSLPTKIAGFSITLLSALAMFLGAENAQRECEECETKENIQKLADLAAFQQKQESKVLFEARSYELDQSVEYKLYQEQKRRELLRILEQDPHQSENIDSLFYQYQEGFYDTTPEDLYLQKDIQSAEPLNQQSIDSSSNSEPNPEPLNHTHEPLNRFTDRDYSQEQNQFTPLKLNRLQMLEILAHLHASGMNQTDMVERLWQVKKGGSAGWKQAHAEFKELIGENNNEDNKEVD